MLQFKSVEDIIKYYGGIKRDNRKKHKEDRKVYK